MEGGDLADYSGKSGLLFLLHSSRTRGTGKATCAGKTIYPSIVKPFSQQWKSVQPAWLSQWSGRSNVGGTTASVAGA